MTFLNVFISAVIGYLFGCIQTAYIIGRLKGIDIRKHGSNNAGASNVTIVMGWKYGIITALIDILKATAAVLICAYIFPDIRILHFIAGAFAVLGHIFPAFLGFKGGKGTASIVGISIALNFKIAIIVVLILVVITIITNYIAIGTIAMYAAFPISAYIFHYDFSCIMILLMLGLLGLYKHRINIKKILAHEEVGLRQVMHK